MQAEYTLPIEYELDLERIKRDLEGVKTPQGWNVTKGGSSVSDIFLYKNRLYFGSCNGKLYCLSIEGKKIWDFDTGDVLLNTLVIKDDVIYLGSFNGPLYALDLEGKTIWTFNIGDKIGDTPLIYKDRIFFGSKAGRFCCLNLEGKLIWEYQTTSIITSAQASGDTVFFGDLTKMNVFSLDGRRLWDYETGSPISSPQIRGDNIFFSSFNRNIYCLTLEGKVKWIREMNSFASVLSALGIVDDKLLIGLMDHYTYCLDCETGKDIWKFNGLILVRPSRYANCLYFGDIDNRLLVVDFQTGIQKWMYLAGGPIVCTPLVTEDKIFFTSWDCYIYCIDKTGKTLWKFKMEGKPSTVHIEHIEEVTIKDQPLQEISLPQLYKSLATGQLETEHVYGSSLSGYVAKEKHYVSRRRYV